MSTQRKTRAHRESDQNNLGLLANGSSGGWEVSVEETTSGPDRWFVQIEGPAAYCSFEVPSPKAIGDALAFLGGLGHPHGRPAGDNGSLAMGKHPQAPAVLIRNDEYADRYFLVVGPDTAQTRLSIAGDDLQHVTEALRQAVEDIENDR